MNKLAHFVALPFLLLWEWHQREALLHSLAVLERQRTHLLDNLERRRR